MKGFALWELGGLPATRGGGVNVDRTEAITFYVALTGLALIATAWIWA